MATRVLIADDHAIVRTGLRALVKGEAGWSWWERRRVGEKHCGWPKACVRISWSWI